MNYIKEIQQLFNLKDLNSFGFPEDQILQVERKFKVRFPRGLRDYYLTLGRNDAINQTHNRLLNPLDEA